jgi:anti-sigma factor RsiW
MNELSPAAVREAQQHADLCAECGGKLWKYRQVVNRLSNRLMPQAVAPGTHCPNLSGAEWREVAAGMWPESKATQLIKHAAFCGHCGPLLRHSISADDRRDEAVRERKRNSRPSLPTRWGLMGWLIPVMALIVMVAVFRAMPGTSGTPLSGAKFAEFAVNTHKQHTQGRIALDLRSGSQLELNQWLKVKSPFSVALPAAPIEAGEERPYDLQGAQLVRVSGKTAAFIAYQVKMATLQTTAASLIVTPDSVAVASGGIEVDFKKVSFHYATVEGYKVVTWSVHGLTYALVSEEGNSTQRSCMVCHSAMKDRDLSQTPAPLRLGRNTPQAVWQ